MVCSKASHFVLLDLGLEVDWKGPFLAGGKRCGFKVSGPVKLDEVWGDWSTKLLQAALIVCKRISLRSLSQVCIEIASHDYQDTTKSGSL